MTSAPMFFAVTARCAIRETGMSVELPRPLSTQCQLINSSNMTIFMLGNAENAWATWAADRFSSGAEVRVLHAPIQGLIPKSYSLHSVEGPMGEKVSMKTNEQEEEPSLTTIQKRALSSQPQIKNGLMVIRGCWFP